MTAAGRPTRVQKKILAVDDDPDVRLLLTMILDAAGYDVGTARDAFEALFMVEHARPDLLLLDLMMPERDGWDVIAAVRANPETRDLPIVAMSAKFSLFNSRDHGVQGYVRKPLDALAMLDTLDEVLRQGT
jgi:CheY-like chemotaxis protein